MTKISPQNNLLFEGGVGGKSQLMFGGSFEGACKNLVFNGRAL